jgi:hypothetical protein
LRQIIIIIGKDTISFMQGIYTYISETNHVPKEHNVAAILSLLFMVPIPLAPALALLLLLVVAVRAVITHGPQRPRPRAANLQGRHIKKNRD